MPDATPRTRIPPVEPGQPVLVGGETGRYGRGVFAGRPIAKGEIVSILKGKPVDIGEIVDRILRGVERNDDPLQVGPRTFLDLDEPSIWFNHGCEPSAGLRQDSELFALRNIGEGEEITYDYSLTVAYPGWRMNCLCGSRICRGIIADVRTVPAERLAFYREHGAIQRYMKPIIEALEDRTYRMPQFAIDAISRLQATQSRP